MQTFNVHLERPNPFWGFFMPDQKTSIIFSTIFVKQHVIMDIVAATWLVECLLKSVEFMFLQSQTLFDTAKKTSSYYVNPFRKMFI